MLHNLVGLWMQKDSVDDNHSYPSVSTPGGTSKHWYVQVFFVIKRELTLYLFPGFISMFINTFYHVCCLLRLLVMKHVRQRKSVYTQTNKNTGFFWVLERERFFEKGTSIN